MEDRMIVRSYRRVFRVDRRIYHVDRWALPVPGGVPLVGVGYFALSLVGMIALPQLPLVEAGMAMLTPPLRYLVLPLVVAVFATHATPDGRSARAYALQNGLTRDELAERLAAQALAPTRARPPRL